VCKCAIEKLLPGGRGFRQIGSDRGKPGNSSGSKPISMRPIVERISRSQDFVRHDSKGPKVPRLLCALCNAGILGID
jgi:hypothetical protein